MATENPWKPFVVPQKFLDSTWKESSPILRLPTEILIQVFDIAGPLDQLALALSCKHLLQVSTFVALKTSSTTETPLLCDRSTMEQLLRMVKPLNAAGREKRSWQMCVDCMRYRPTRKSYWKKKRAAEWNMGNWDSTVARWNIKYLLQCPECYYQELRPTSGYVYFSSWAPAHKPWSAWALDCLRPRTTDSIHSTAV